ncbi:MAG: acyl carrier protein [Alphaproteobacteria bacterium]
MDFIRAEANVAPTDPDFSDAADLFDLGYLDSFSLVRLIEWAKDRFGTDIGNADFFNDLRTAGRIADHIDTVRAA